MNSSPLFATKDLLLLFYLFPFRILAEMLPAKILRRIGSLMVHLYGALAVGKQRDIEERLRLAFKDTVEGKEIEKLAKQYILNAGLKDVDDMILNRLTREELLQCSQMIGLENLERALSFGKGVVLVSGHFFANRVGKRFLSEIGFPVLSVRKSSSRHPALGRLATKHLKSRYVNFVNEVVRDYVFIEDKDCTLKILARLRGNGLVDIHVDGHSSYHLMEYPFLGRKRSFPSGFLRIVYLSGAAVVPMLCIGDSGSFTIFFEEMVQFIKTSDQETFVSKNLPRIVEKLEYQVWEHADQWELWGIKL